MRTCFVSIPFGIKPTVNDLTIDFDSLYVEVIRPVVEEMGLESNRLDDYPGTIWQKNLFSALISSDLMIADITTDNANVFYEIGIRHALKRSRTILISAKGHPPIDLGYTRVLMYQPDSSGRLLGPDALAFREELKASIQQSQRSSLGDSPVYAFFPELEVILPPELESSPRLRRFEIPRMERGFTKSAVESPAQTRGYLEKSEEAIRGTPDADPTEYLTLLRRYRDLSDWDRVIALADDAPLSVSQSFEIQQLLALALNRRGTPGDQDRAIMLMENLIKETGGDSETFGILGRIYKDRYDQAKMRGDLEEAAENLERALKNYRAGFEKNPRDYYPGVNVVNLLLQKNDETARTELEKIVPRVRAAVLEKIDDNRMDFWVLATDLQLAAVAKDWERAKQSALSAVNQAPADWMIETTLRDIRMVGKLFTDPTDRNEFDRIIELLEQGHNKGGAI